MKINSLTNLNSFTNLLQNSDTESLSSLLTTSSLQTSSNRFENDSNNNDIGENSHLSLGSQKYFNCITSHSSGLSYHEKINMETEKEFEETKDALNEDLKKKNRELSFAKKENFKFPVVENQNNLKDLQMLEGTQPIMLNPVKKNEILESSITNKNDNSQREDDYNGVKHKPDLYDKLEEKNRNEKSHDLDHFTFEKNIPDQISNNKRSKSNENANIERESESSKTSPHLLAKYDEIKSYRKRLEDLKEPELLIEYIEYMLKTSFEIREENPDFSKKLIQESCHYLKKLSMKGYTNAQYLLADIYSTELLGKTNFKKALVLFQTAAKHGHIESAFRTAECYEKGLGVARDSRKAVEFLKFAASRNHSKSMLKLGKFLFTGSMGFNQDYKTQQNGINWISRASARADKSCSEAPYELAKIYEKGFLDIIIPDQKYAVNLYIQSASLGHTKSNTKLAQIYETGIPNIEPNILLSIHYCTEASQSKTPDPQAQLKLCSWYLSGVDELLDIDLEESFFWAEKAALLEFPKAQYTLGNFYEKGVGCKADSKSAYNWYAKAANNGYSKAQERLKKLAKQLELEVQEKSNKYSSQQADNKNLKASESNKQLTNKKSDTTVRTHRSSNSLFSLSKIFNSQPDPEDLVLQSEISSDFKSDTIKTNGLSNKTSHLTRRSEKVNIETETMIIKELKRQGTGPLKSSNVTAAVPEKNPVKTSTVTTDLLEKNPNETKPVSTRSHFEKDETVTSKATTKERFLKSRKLARILKFRK